MKKGDLIWGGVLGAISLLLVIPASRAAFVSLTHSYFYPMSFLKFAVLATMGEMLAVRILQGEWRKPKGLAAKAAAWGVFGLLIALMFGVFNGGAKACADAGLLPGGGDGIFGVFLIAFYTSAIMNVTFGPVMMSSHRVSDTWIDRRIEKAADTSILAAIKAVDWVGFIRFAVLKTVPFFWIPAHTLVFLLPPEYRVLASAYLSIVLGAMMAYVKRQAQVTIMTATTDQAVAPAK